MFNATEHAELVNDFVDQLGVSETTAAIASSLFQAVTASVDGEQAQNQEFERALQQSVAQGESWATEIGAKMLEKRLPEFRTTYQRALASGQEPSTALEREHTLAQEAAKELVALLSREAAAADGSRREQHEHRETSSAPPVIADVSSNSTGEITITVDPTATVASARVDATENTGPCADAARNATVRLDGDRLTVSVPEPEPTRVGNMTFRGGTAFQNVSYVGPGQTMTGVTIDNNGDMHVGNMTGATQTSSSINIDITVPPGSAAKVRGHNPNLTVHGALAALATDLYNGDVRTALLGQAHLRGHNGDYTIEAVQGEIDSESYNGDMIIRTYSGNRARMKSHNGDLELTASRQAQGPISAHTYNGDITLRGVRGHSDLQVSHSTRKGDVRES